MPAPDDALMSALRLCFTYGDSEILSEVSLQVEAGEVLAVVGPSGAGKSSLLLCLAGLARPQHGAVSFHGRRVDNLRVRERDRLRRTSYGFVFQHGDLVPELTVAENVALPLRLQGRAAAAAMVAAHEALDGLGISILSTNRGVMSDRKARAQKVGGELLCKVW